jgi:oxygen-independent coproporphyrinogen-3 oxidase
VPGTPPDGQPAPRDGLLPEPALAGLGQRPFGVYLHVPFCVTRCGYCDFTTYTAEELGEPPGASRASWVRGALAELRLARRVLGPAEVPVHSVFVGGGTPTLLPPADLLAVRQAVDDLFGLLPGAEVSTEANPDSVTPRTLDALRAGGFTRVSFGMQSVVPHVLAVLDRTHTPGRAVAVVADAKQAGFEHVNLDLIYGTPGESDADWRATLDAAVAAGPDHLSAYALIVEPGTRLAARIRRGELPAPDDDVLADRYEAADDVLGAAGYAWYEVSNWARGRGARCRHNVGYWTGGDWWGVGPGAHSHVGGTRWWNVRHPAAWAGALATGSSPAEAREVLGAETRRVERVLLELRLASGLPLDVLDGPGRAAALAAAGDGLLEAGPLAGSRPEGRAVLTRRGRLLADAVVGSLVG